MKLRDWLLEVKYILGVVVCSGPNPYPDLVLVKGLVQVHVHGLWVYSCRCLLVLIHNGIIWALAAACLFHRRGSELS